MPQHRLFTIDTDVPVYFCDPHSPVTVRTKWRVLFALSGGRLDCVFEA
jgi:hypothetical protein